MSESKRDSRAGVGGRCFELWPRLVNAVFVCLLWGTTATATDWYVDDVTDPLEDGSQLHPYDTIQEGIDAAAIGDTVLVLDGTYSGTGNQEMSFGGKDITVRSLNGASGSIIDCPGDADPRRAFLFLAGETLAATLDGFR